MSIIRGASTRRKARGTIQDRVTSELKRLAAERALKEGCHHRFPYTRRGVPSYCLDCGARQ